MSESGLWGLLVDFYREHGPDAWRSVKVPYRMTCNGYLADVYASVAGAFLRDWQRWESCYLPSPRLRLRWLRWLSRAGSMGS